MSDLEELGFSEFVAKLISETFTAVVESTIEQERRYGELVAAAELPLEQFASTYVGDDELADELRVRFPPGKRRPGGVPEEAESAVAEGQPYTAPGRGRPERPPLREELGIEVDPEEVEDGTISAGLARRIADEVRARLAEPEWLMARAVVARGVPRVMVDSGHVMAKQTYHVVSAQEEDEDGTAAPARPEPAVRPRSLALDRVLRPTIRPDLLIRIRSPRSTEPTSEANIYGEVQVTFKTVP